MAEVSKIVYQVDFDVNAAELEGVKTRLNDAAQSAAKVGGAGFDKLGKSVASVNSELDKLRTKRDATGDPTKVAAYDAQIRKLEADLVKLNATAGQTGGVFNKVNSNALSASNSAVNLGKSFAGTALAFGATVFAVDQLGQALIGLGKNAVNSAISFEQTRIALEVIAGSAENAELILRQVDALAIKSPFDTAELEKSARAILSIGVEADKVVPTLQLLTDVAASGGKLTAEQLERTVRAFTQVQTKGKVSAEELNQFGDANIRVRDLLANELNISLAELQKQLELGRIPAQALTNAFITATSEGGKFAGLSEKLSQSTGGRLNTAIDTFNLTLRDLGTKVLPLVTFAVDFFGSSFAKLIRFYELAAQKVTDFLDKNEGLKSGLQGVLDFITPVFELIGKFFFDTPRQLFAVGSAFIGTFKDIGNAALALADVLQALVSLNFEQVRFTFSKFTDQIGNSLDVVGKYEEAIKEFDAVKPREEIDKLTKSNADLLKSTAAGAKGQKDYAAAIREKTEAVKADTKAIEDATRAAIRASDALNQETESIRNTAVGDDFATERENLENTRKLSAEKNKLEAKFALENVAIRRQAAVDKLNVDKQNAIEEINEAKISLEAKNQALLVLEKQYNAELDRITKKSIADRAKTEQLSAAKSANELQKILAANAQTLFELQSKLDAQLLANRVAALSRDATNTDNLVNAIIAERDAALAKLDSETDKLRAREIELRFNPNFDLDERLQSDAAILRKQIDANAAYRVQVETEANDKILHENLAGLERANDAILKELNDRLTKEANAQRANLSLTKGGLRSGGGLREALGLPSRQPLFEERADIQAIDTEIANLNKELELAVKSGGLFSEKVTEIADKINKLQNERSEKFAEKRVADAKKVFEATVSLFENALQLVNTIYDIQIQRANDAISKQEEYIDKIKEGLNAGIDAQETYTAKQLALEEKRLAEIQKKRDKDVRAQQALAQIEIATNLAVAIAKAAAEGGGVLSAITIAAAIAAAAAGFVKSRALAQQAVPSFGEGGLIKGKSHKEGGVLINAEGGEYVVRKDKVPKWKPVLEGINKGTLSISDITQSVNKSRGDYESSKVAGALVDISALVSEMQAIKAAISSQTLTSRTSGEDLEHVVSRVANRKRIARQRAS